jgi:serine phosphatase RsbU (regulator of sigma subunit)
MVIIKKNSKIIFIIKTSQPFNKIIMKYYKKLLLILIILIPFQLSAEAYDLGDAQWFFTEGFNSNWIENSPDFSNWKRAPERRIEARKHIENKSESVITFTTGCRFIYNLENTTNSSVAAIILPRIGMNWEIYLNGNLLEKQVFLSSDKSSIQVSRAVRKYVVPFSTSYLNPNSNTLLIKITGYHDYELTGITTKDLKIGTLKEIDNNVSETFNFAVILIFFVFGLYHLVLYLKRKKENFYLYFAIFSVLISSYLFTRSSIIFTLFTNIDTSFITRIELMILFPLPGIFLLFLESLFYGKTTIPVRIYLFSNLAASLAVPFLPYQLLLPELSIWQVITLLGLIYSLFAMLREYFRGSIEARFLVGGSIIFFGVTIYDIVLTMIFNTNSGASGIGFFIFMLGIIASLGDRFMRVHNDLEELSAHLEEKVHDRTEELEAAMEELKATIDYVTYINDIYEKDLLLASTVQRGLIPVEKIYSSWDVQVFYQPHAQVSGDFYDIYEYPEGSLGIILCDVSGHGISSALITMIAKPIFQENLGNHLDYPLDYVMKHANEQLISSIKQIDKYLTGVVFRLGEDYVSFCNAAHPNIYIVKKNGTIIEIESSGTILGIPDLPDFYKEEKFQVESGDLVFAYTDALIESKNSEGIDFGEERLKKIISQAHTMETDELIDILFKEVRYYIGGDKFDDDLTMIACRKK